MEFHHRDRYNIGSFNGDIDSEKLQSEYVKYQSAWKHSNAVGGIPEEICLMLAVKYPKLAAKEKAAPVKTATKTATKTTTKKVAAKA